MNFLAHIYLSGQSDEIKLGNFIADWVKGSPDKWNINLNQNIRKGILLHRFIDYETDSHPIFLKSKEKLKPVYGKYAGIVCDIFYDHFLAVNWEMFSNQKLRKFAFQFYFILLKNFRILPTEIKRFLPFFIYNNRLVSYTYKEKIRIVLDIMVKHTSLPAKTNLAMEILNSDYQELNSEFLQFFSYIQMSSNNYLKSILSK